MSRKALFAAALTAMTLAGCAESIAADTVASFAERWPEVFADRWATLPAPATTAPAANRALAVPSIPAAVNKDTRASLAPAHKQTERASYGLASFYWQGSRTASGERFDKRELTAAHRTLPFGTRVLVTNLATGRSVTVRVNDRGPFVAGRIIDVSRAAAEELGMVGRGVTKVKLTVVE
jgi:peptidoglycan lytic transglycosylase